ncbi:acetate/propionate family kinase [Saccharopolyspora griseoalba]|uniref:Acetate kinase n=1 Tax=Saccharopolyspora griseoalba TaxID=1431848 RepID=A0ABW2LNK9_9PSEU
MRVLALNPGSSRMKGTLVERGVAHDSASWPGADESSDERAVDDAVRRWGHPDAVAVRFVHGGSRARPELVDDDLLARLARLTPLAPLHQPLSLGVASAARSVLPDVPVVASFDTAFHRGLPKAAARYALPRTWSERFTRHGFHGLSCRYALRHTSDVLGVHPGEVRMLCCHIGSGVSVTAVRRGTSADTSMGFTPLEGAVMSTRSGSVDPGLLLHLLDSGEVDLAALADALQHRSGLAGLSGTSGDVREVLAARARGDRDAALAIDVFTHRLRREIGSCAMSLDRLDAIAFTGGVAENQPGLLGEILDGLAPLDLTVDRELLFGSGDRLVSEPGTGAAVLVVESREDLELARDARDALRP